MISEEKALKTYDQIEVNKKAAGDQLLLVAQFMTKRELERLEHRRILIISLTTTKPGN